MFKVSVFLLVYLFGKYILTIFASVNKQKIQYYDKGNNNCF